ncbi:CBK_G0011240.mRNA.1.CDS.1 [Saccharomyces cerevisiae]|nr:CBK_G0011240.mRNA.1.CDS.1 [Saccharomyces cerevisiae]CAI7213530.1 CBK_G0011240.mRNA.1.CDS.1 [Saccharomyces cerevisiae]
MTVTAQKYISNETDRSSVSAGTSNLNLIDMLNCSIKLSCTLVSCVPDDLQRPKLMDQKYGGTVQTWN